MNKPRSLQEVSSLLGRSLTSSWTSPRQWCCSSVLPIVLCLVISLRLVDGFTTKTPVFESTLLRRRFGRPFIVPNSDLKHPFSYYDNNGSRIQASQSSTLFGKQDRQQQLQQQQQQQQTHPTFPKNGVIRMSRVSSFLTKMGMMGYITSMCLTLPIALLPQAILFRVGLISRVQKQIMALASGQFCARWLLRVFPFCRIDTKVIGMERGDLNDKNKQQPEPSIWVCNHASALDIFILLAKDLELRGIYKRPIKIVYWKGLEDNPITKLLFQQCGFIPVEMVANAAGEANDYDMKSFRKLLKMTKQAFEEGFDIGILPEGQLNPHPEKGLLPCFPGAYTLGKMSKRPIQMMALHGTHQLWHAREDIGMTVTGRDVAVRIYHHPSHQRSTSGGTSVTSSTGGRRYESPDEFLMTFNAVVGTFATTGSDLDDIELTKWLDGSKWESLKRAQSGKKDPQSSTEAETVKDNHKVPSSNDSE